MKFISVAKQLLKDLQYIERLYNPTKTLLIYGIRNINTSIIQYINGNFNTSISKFLKIHNRSILLNIWSINYNIQYMKLILCYVCIKIEVTTVTARYINKCYVCIKIEVTTVTMKIENHYLRLKENLDVLDDSIKIDIIKRQSTIGFCVSAASIHMIEILLHKNNLIDSSYIIKHEWFKSKHKIDDKINFEFPKKEEIIELLKDIQEKRNELCYGTPKKEKEIVDYIKKFNKLKEIFESLGVKNEK